MGKSLHNDPFLDICLAQRGQLGEITVGAPGREDHEQSSAADAGDLVPGIFRDAHGRPDVQLRDRLNGHGLTAGDAVKLETNVS